MRINIRTCSITARPGGCGNRYRSAVGATALEMCATNGRSGDVGLVSTTANAVGAHLDPDEVLFATRRGGVELTGTEISCPGNDMSPFNVVMAESEDNERETEDAHSQQDPGTVSSSSPLVCCFLFSLVNRFTQGCVSAQWYTRCRHSDKRSTLPQPETVPTLPVNMPTYLAITRFRFWLGMPCCFALFFLCLTEGECALVG